MSTKENNKNAQNTGGGSYKGGYNKKFVGVNVSLQGKVFEITARDAVHQFAETIKAIADYVGQEYTHGGDIRYMVENFEDFVMERPENPINEEDRFEIESWKKQLDLYWKRMGIYQDNKMKLYSLVWGQSSKTTQSKIETHANFQQCKSRYDSLGLLKIIREFVFKSDDRQYKYKAEDQAKRAYYNLRQTPEMSCQEYFERVRNIVEVIKSLGGSLCDDMHLEDELPQQRTRPTAEQNREARKRIVDKKVAYGILVRADRNRYGKLIEEIENDFLMGNNNYPQTPTEAYNLLVNYKNYGNAGKRNATPGNLDQVAFVANTDGGTKDHSNIKCFKCGVMGHYKSDCPKRNQGGGQVNQVTATTLMTRAITMATGLETINPMWILCDNESTVDVFANKSMLSDVRQAKKPFWIKGIGGTEDVMVNQEGDLPGYGTVYYNPKVAANIISFFRMTKKFKTVTYDNRVKDAFVITREDGSNFEFKPSVEGLYYYDFSDSIRRQQEKERQNQIEEPAQQIMMIETVEEIKRNFTKRELDAADEARRLYVIVGRPSKKAFEDMIQGGWMMNNPITIQDYRNALKIYGEDLGVLKGKTSRKKTHHVKVETEERNVTEQRIVLGVDLMYFMGLVFLITVSRNIRFITATVLADRKKLTILQAIKQVMMLYKSRGHQMEKLEFDERDNPVHTILADNEFYALREELENEGVSVNVVAKEEHVPEVERQNRVIKERARAIVQTLPYSKIPKRMQIALIQYVVSWMNHFPKEGQYRSPREMVLGCAKLDYKKVCRLPFGAYVQVHDDRQITNTMEPRTTGAINLGPTWNIQGGHRFMNLTTGDVIIRRSWTEIPVPSEVILRVEELAKNANDAVEMLLEEDDDEETQVIDKKEDDQIAEVEEQELITPGVIQENIEENQAQDIDITEGYEIRDDTEEVSEETRNEDEEENVLDVSNSAETITTSNITRRHGYSLRPNRSRDYSYRFAMLSLKAGIKRWGKKAKDAMLDELRLFLSEEVFEQLHNPTRKQMEMALRIHCFVIEKRDDRIKARAVADGSTQQRYTEEENYSPTVKLESIFLSSLIDAYEQRNVVTIDIKGAFLKASVPDDMELVVKMEGELAELLCELDPRYKLNENGVLYLKCKKALYGHIEASRLFYDDLVRSLTEKMGFKMNPYDPCVFNKRTSDGAITIRTHVDDLKVSSRSMKQINHVISQLKEIYKEITVHEGESHYYLGMVMTYDKNNQEVTVNMERYISESIQDFEENEPYEKLKQVATPATDTLFKTRTGAVEKLASKQATLFHAIVAKLLFVAKRGRPDILLAVSFLTTRVKEPDLDDWKRLIRVLSYLKSTLSIHLTLHCSQLDKLTWYIDGSYATHADMKGQSGAVLVAGGCVVLSRSNKQKVNTRSSTEAELIAVDDALPTVQWTKSFMSEQGFELNTWIKEDNRSTMLLMKNGKLSSGKRTKHLDIRYFYVKDLVDRGIINIDHCVSDEMIADFFTKPLQGKRFQVLRDIIMNINATDSDSSLTIQERVGKQSPENIVREESARREKPVSE